MSEIESKEAQEPYYYRQVWEVPQQEDEPFKWPEPKTWLFHGFLLALTFFSCAWSGIGLMGKTAVHGDFPSLFMDGVPYAFMILGFLATHEFGHYFAAVYHRIKTTLPYFIPMPIFFIGTMGAVIRIKERIDRTHKLFDVGIAGPIAGFVVSFFLLLYGFITLPGPEYLFNFGGHNAIQDYIREYGTYPQQIISDGEGQTMVMGPTLLYSFLASFFEYAPPMYEMYHFPFLFTGWLGLFFTALNLMPIGQLDGGHILYSLIGYHKHRTVARIFLAFLLLLAGVGIVPELQLMLRNWGYTNLYFAWFIWALMVFGLLRRAYRGDHAWIAPALIGALGGAAILLYGVVDPKAANGFAMWGLWALIAVFFIQIEHPPVVIEEPLTPGRKILGWTSVAIFILCISPNPIYLVY